MIAERRLRVIQDEIRRLGAVSVGELAAKLNVSDMTVRRDLAVLAERGLAAKVHGGAVAVGPASTDEPGFAAKSRQQRLEKAAIARRAAELVTPGASVGISAGTTTAELAHHLCDIAGITVVTNSVPVADILHTAGRPDQTVILTGGVRTPSDALVGPVAALALRDLHLDLVFLGVHGMHPDAGFTTPNLTEAETHRALIATSGRLVVVADHSKWETVGMCSMAPLSKADVLVTDTALPATALERLTAEITTVILAEAAATEQEETP